MSHKYEIEIKSLLGEKENADLLREKITARNGKKVSEHKQLNHYFLMNDKSKLYDAMIEYVTEEKKDSFKKVLDEGSSFSIRSRDADGKVILVIKASIDEGTSDNAVSRIEFESVVDMTLDELDQKLISAGLEYQAKWSREREEYELEDGNVVICLDKNAGYGYLAEFETVVEEETKADETKKYLLSLMEEMGVSELPQDRLERMFEYYNNNWSKYYGTDNVFVIE